MTPSSSAEATLEADALPTSATLVHGELPPAAPAATVAPSSDTFLDLAGVLPGDLASGQLRVMVCDPGTLYVYWTTSEGWANRHYRLSCKLDDGSAWSQELPAGGRECWLTVPTGANGVVAFEVLDAGSQRVLGRVHFEAPPGRPAIVAPKGVWRVPGHAHDAPSHEAGATPASAPPADGLPTQAAPTPEGIGPDDVMLESRLYHGHVWKAA